MNGYVREQLKGEVELEAMLDKSRQHLTLVEPVAPVMKPLSTQSAPTGNISCLPPVTGCWSRFLVVT